MGTNELICVLHEYGKYKTETKKKKEELTHVTWVHNM